MHYTLQKVFSLRFKGKFPKVANVAKGVKSGGSREHGVTVETDNIHSFQSPSSLSHPATLGDYVIRQFCMQFTQLRILCKQRKRSNTNKDVLT